jgi:hypothetical protein
VSASIRALVASCARQVPDPAELLRRHAIRQRTQDVRLRAADAVGDQRHDMAVAAVLTQQIACVPQPGKRLLRAGSVRSAA